MKLWDRFLSYCEESTFERDLAALNRAREDVDRLEKHLGFPTTQEKLKRVDDELDKRNRGLYGP